MSLDDIYKTIDGPAQGLYKEKGSKFLAFAWPIQSEEEIKNYVAELKTEYYNARHHCYAWQIGMEGMNYRANDDGEPSGTAGKPIHGQIRSFELTNILIVVVRYFGGTKLGTSGLMHAYKTAAADAIGQATIVERTVDNQVDIRFPYESMNDVMRVIKEEVPNIVHQQFNLTCAMTLSIRQSKMDALISRLEKVNHLTMDGCHSVADNNRIMNKE
jgi:uncharacterized YigZ family protein